MSYRSIDEIQTILSQEVFKSTQSPRKAAGRALGTLVELITYYMIRQWQLSSYVQIELRIPEFGNSDITHNVEFGLHPRVYCQTQEFENLKLPINPQKIQKALKDNAFFADSNFKWKTAPLLKSIPGTNSLLQRNRCVLGTNSELQQLVIADLLNYESTKFQGTIEISMLKNHPFAIFECKRVGVEEGAKKGPTTIEKAKQGAYVAQHVSALQKIRRADGTIFGALAKPDGSFDLKKLYDDALKNLIYDAPAEALQNFVLTIGIASNHGNWFTSDNPNKELLVLKQSYDWLLFLTDQGLCKFIEDLILPKSTNNVVGFAFRESYAASRTVNQFTKVNILRNAHLVLEKYFQDNIDSIEKEWFNIISPQLATIEKLKEQLNCLVAKDWK
ncbi:hypothetical protein [Planktothricoides raciborskii]|uniref:Uncharacterized protein n=1 Tax=Planktothricoides raciborskii GIHE-MW2 TaxID=2792601 RepID=A0AAU8JLE6_9CYAN